jgi:DNA-binding transcriptional LysR family regulator
MLCKNAGMMDWSDLRYALAISRAGSLAAAARRLGVDQTTVARRLAALERGLAARLFDRIDGTLRPTKAGVALLARAEGAERAIEGIAEAIAGSDLRAEGAVRLTAVPILANRLLVPAIPGLLARHPGLRLELVAEPRNLSLGRREADIALRLARPESGTALARRIGRLDYAVFVARHAREPRRLPWITYDAELAHLPQARWIARAMGEGETAVLTVNDAEAMLQAVLAGLGRSLLPCFLAAGEPRLRRLGAKAPALSREIWLLVHRELRHLARVAAVIDWLEALPAAAARPAAGRRH